MAPTRVAEDANVAYLGPDHPSATEGPGFYEVTKDNEHQTEFNEDGDSVNVTLTNTEVKFGKKLEWVKANPEAEGEQPDPENNEGYWVYADSIVNENQAITDGTQQPSGGSVNG